MNICMRWMWRLWLRSSLPRVLLFLMISITCFHLLANEARVHLTNGGRISEGMTAQVVQQESEKRSEKNNEGPIDVPTRPKVPKPTSRQKVSLAPFGDWVEVAESSRDVFVYSAYLDRRGNFNVIRIVAIIRKHKKVSACEVWSGNTTQRVPGKSRMIRENWNLAYAAAYILCEVAPSLQPTRVVPVLNDKVDLNSVLPVQVFSERSYGNLSVCVKPFHYEFNRAVWLVEFIELYRLLGTDQFIFYNHTVGPDVQLVLSFYQKLGLVTVLPWALPVVSQKEIRTEGIFAALNDCNLRSVGRYSLTAMVDVDEFLVPRNHDTLPELIQLLGNYDAFIFQNVFFYLYWENDTAVHDTLFSGDGALGPSLFGSEELTPYLLTAYKTRRLNAPHKHGQRSKYIVRPERIVEVGNHVIWDSVGPKRVKNVRPDLGLSHHYRICEFGGFDCLKQPNQVDRTTHKWLVPMVKSVAAACSEIFPSSGRCPEAPPLGSPW